MSRDARFSPPHYARIGGILYLLIITAGLFAQFVRGRFVVPGNAAATASNITNEAFMFRLGLSADLSTFVCAVPLTIILYTLLKPVSRNAALLMLGFSVVQDAIGGLNVLNTYRPLQLLGLTLSTAQLLSPPVAAMLFPSILVAAHIGKLSFAVWLTVKGVNLARWREITQRSGPALL